MSNLKKRRNRCDTKLLATFIPAIGAERHLWLTHFAKRLPETAAQLGWNVAEARERAGALRT